MFLVANRLLEQRDAVVEQFQSPRDHRTPRPHRCHGADGDDVAAAAIQAAYPRVIIEPHVDASAVLRDKLLAGEVDLMIVPEIFDDQRFESKRVGTAEHAWMCKPGLIGPRRRLRIHELAAHRLLSQDDRSGTGQLHNRWLRSLGVTTDNALLSNSVLALIGLTVSGIGICYRPKKCLTPMIEAGALEELAVTPALPPAN